MKIKNLQKVQTWIRKCHENNHPVIHIYADKYNPLYKGPLDPVIVGVKNDMTQEALFYEFEKQ